MFYVLSSDVRLKNKRYILHEPVFQGSCKEKNKTKKQRPSYMSWEGKRAYKRVKKRFAFLPHALLCEHMHESIESFQKMGRPPVAGLLQFQ